MSEIDAYRALIDTSTNYLRRNVAAQDDPHFFQRPAPGANSVAFVYFHVLRHWDWDVNMCIRGQGPEGDLWNRGGFTERSGYDPAGNGPFGTGYDASQSEVDRMTASKDALLAYHDELASETSALLDSMTEDDLRTESASPVGTMQPASERLQHLIFHTGIHIGDISFIIGMLEKE